MPKNVKTEVRMGDLCVGQIYVQNRYRKNTVYIQYLFYALVGSWKWGVNKNGVNQGDILIRKITSIKAKKKKSKGVNFIMTAN